MKKTALFLLAILVVAGAGAFWVQLRGGSSEPSSTLNPDEFARLQEENQNLKERIAALESRAARKRTERIGDLANKPAEERKATKPKLSYEEEYRQLVETEAKIARELDNILIEQSYDPEWAKATEELARNFISGAEDGKVKLVDASCKRTLCRVAMTFPDMKTKDVFLGKITEEPPFNTSGWMHSEGIEDNEIEIYFARKGEKFPKLDFESKTADTP